MRKSSARALASVFARAMTILKAKFNAAIAKVRADGTYETIAKKYFDFDIFGE